jgi:predicted phosphodiesterase
MVWASLLIVLAAGMAWAAEPCRFVVMGDNRPQWGGDDVVTPSVMYQRAIDEVNLLQPELVLIAGDLIYGYDEDMELIEREWEAFDQATARFEMPVHLVAGNHDIWDGPSEEMYQQRYGPLWYSFDRKDCHFVVLDSEDQTAPNQIAGEQLEWLRADLAAARGKRIFVFLHKPLWEEEDPDNDWGENVHPLLAEAGADTVFAGHWHIYRQAPTKDGVRYIITGGAGAEIGDDPLLGDFYHYIMVTAPPAGEGESRLAVIRTGSVDPEDAVTASSVAAFSSLMSQMEIRPLLVGEGLTVERASLEVTNPFDESASLALEFGGVRRGRRVGGAAEPRRSHARRRGDRRRGVLPRGGSRAGRERSAVHRHCDDRRARRRHVRGAGPGEEDRDLPGGGRHPDRWRTCGVARRADHRGGRRRAARHRARPLGRARGLLGRGLAGL